jgi:gluconolactonase
MTEGGELRNVREVGRGLRFPEGPVALADGSVLVSEMRSGAIVRVSPEGDLTVVAECGGAPNGAAIGPDGWLWVANNGGGDHTDYIGGRIQRVDISSGRVQDAYRSANGHPLRAPNDLVFDGDGGFWFTDMGKRRGREVDLGAVLYARADRWEISEVVFGADRPNGIGLSPERSSLYWSETYTGRVWRRSVTAPGQLAAVHGRGPIHLSPDALLAHLGGVRCPDSLAVDSEGNICVAVIGAQAGLCVVSPTGDVSHLTLPPEFDDWGPTNICFGGPDLSTAYITLTGTGRLIACDWPVPGLPLAHGL